MVYITTEFEPRTTQQWAILTKELGITRDLVFADDMVALVVGGDGPVVELYSPGAKTINNVPI